MKRVFKKVLVSTLTACFALSLSAMPAFAAESGTADAPGKLSTPYTYTVTLSAGNGAIGGEKGAVQTHPELSYGGTVSLGYADAVAPEGHYAKGIHLAGRDITDDVDRLLVGDPATRTVNVNVQGDAQYVVAYGLESQRVAYTLNFVDENGNQLAEPETYYGSVGDKPVVAVRYIDNYLPNAYNITKTLSANEADNVFAFTYTPAPGVTYETVTLPGGTTVTTVAVDGAPVPGVAADAGAAAALDAAADAGQIIGDDGNPLAAPEELVDIDDEENPLASGLEESASGLSSDLSPLFIGIGAVVVVAIIAAVVVASRKRQKKANAEQ